MAKRQGTAPKVLRELPGLPLSQFMRTVGAMHRPAESITGMLPKGQTMVLCGGPFMGKSVETQNLCCAFGAGGDFHGLPVEKCLSLYLTFEGDLFELHDRFGKIWPRFNIEPAYEPIIKKSLRPMPLNTDKGRLAFLDLVKPHVDNGLQVVLWDSFRHSVRGHFSKDEAVMQNWLDGCAEVSDATGLTIIFVWELTKLMFTQDQQNPYSIDRLKGAAEVGYAVNTIVMIGEQKGRRKVRSPHGYDTTEWASLGYRIVPLKVKGATGNFPILRVDMDHELLMLRGQSWKVNGNEVLIVEEQ